MVCKLILFCSDGIDLFRRGGIRKAPRSVYCPFAVPEPRRFDEVSEKLHALEVEWLMLCRISYIAYLDMLRQGKVERTLDTREKALPEYMAYVQSLYDYLISFFNRALPLVNIHTKLQEEEDNFASAWEAGQISGWERTDGKAKAAVSAPAGEGIWCGYCK